MSKNVFPNGLELIKLKKTDPEKLAASKIDEIISNCSGSDYSVVAYLDNEVLIGKLINKQFRFFKNTDDSFFSFIQKIRIFNESEEILFWRNGKTLIGRRRIDETGEDISVVEAEQIIYGTKKESLSSNTPNITFIKLTEDRGTEIILPDNTDNNYSVNENTKRIAVKTRNYIDYSETGIASYVDCRFVCFKQYKGE